jgi:thymidine phosphorylase
MNEPLAPCAGNAIEVRCALDYLTGKSRPARLHEITMALSVELLLQSGLYKTEAAARDALTDCLANGRATEIFEHMVAALGGPSDLIANPDKYLEQAPVVVEVPAKSDGVVAAMDTRALGLAVVGLGGGRRRAADAIDFAVGLTDFVELGATIKAGAPLAYVHARTLSAAEEAVQSVQTAIKIAEGAPAKHPAVYQVVRE